MRYCDVIVVCLFLLDREKVARSKTGKGRRSTARIGRRKKTHREVCYCNIITNINAFITEKCASS